jgi:DNA (cytosine-5)-methyltransferase 1
MSNSIQTRMDRGYLPPAEREAAITYLSLFSGIGGLDLGLDRAGWTCVGQVELDAWCRTVLDHHWPEVPKHDDVRTAPEWWAGEPRPAVRLVAGGFPCQPFSFSGYRRGIADERWGWPWMLDVIRATQPEYVLVENVPGLLADRDAFGTVLADLAGLGFDAEWSLLRASQFGAPHPRERLYLVAYPEGVDGGARDLLGQSGERGPSLAARGLSGLAAHQRRRDAGEWLAREPRVARLAHGLPGWLDRTKALGNAVVPAVGELVGRLIREHAGQSTSAGGAR